MAKRTSGPKWAIFNPWTLETTRGHQLNSKNAFPSIKGKDSPSPMYTVPRIKAWCICGIIYHYAPILLRNSMVILSGPNYAIPIQGPKSITHFKGSLFSHSVLQFLAATRRPFGDPNHLALQELGCNFFSRLFQGKFQEVMNNSISCQGIKYFSIPWTTQLVHTGCI
ncbi:hypothetical protein O181_093485 [Austropuccinia psidii MF-1]|uniref:Uncharacterized protein n=1 Tax=Austropuccinia psidii MF-1 TaxID=1389203 RepID=A0A9Q3J0D0_9BASI|nr:hypothetical protein [Austropuccinia psidii MF-1]